MIVESWYPIDADYSNKTIRLGNGRKQIFKDKNEMFKFLKGAIKELKRRGAPGFHNNGYSFTKH